MKKQPEPFMGTVKVGPKGQIVIPKEIRDMFGIEPGQQMVVMGHPERGIALYRQDVLLGIADAIFAGKGREVFPNEDQSHLGEFAEIIKKNVGNGEEK